MKNKVKIIISFGISIVLIYLAFLKVDIIQIIDNLKNTSITSIILASLMSVVNIYIRAIRWKFLLSHLKKITVNTVFKYTMIGFMANNILPAHAGEFVRAYLIGKSENIGKAAAFTTIIIERILDFLVIVLLLLLLLPFLRIPDIYLTIAVIVGAVCIILIFTLIVFASRSSQLTERLLVLFKIFPEKIKTRIRQIITSFISGIVILKNYKLLNILLLLSVVLWIQSSVTFMIILYTSFDSINSGLLICSFSLLFITSFGVMIPSSPGYFGIIQMAFILGLGLYGFNKSIALTHSITYHMTQYIPITLLGLLFILHEKIKIFQISTNREVP